MPSFERYISQLKMYYQDCKHLTESPKMYFFLGCNLLHLLAEDRIADFHTELEQIPVEQIYKSVHIKHPVQIEQSLMEGSYNRVWNSREAVPAPEYAFFMDMLTGTIRYLFCFPRH